MSNYPYPPNPYGPVPGGGSVPGGVPGPYPYSLPAGSPDPYAAGTPQPGAPYPGYGPVAGGYPGTQPYPDPRSAVGAYPVPTVYDPVLAHVQQLAAISSQTRSNLLGNWALGMSLLSVFCCTYGICQLLGLGLGIAGLVAAGNGHATNKGVSVAAVVLALFSIVLWIGIGYMLNTVEATTV